MNRLRLPRLIGDNMVLQRNRPVRLYGWAPAAISVNLLFEGQTYSAQADNEGRWDIILPPQPAGGPFKMVFSAGDESVSINNVALGDVWICSGQSNMALPLERVCFKYPREIKQGCNSMLRLFKVPDTWDFESPREDCEGGEWKAAEAEELKSFSALAFFFGSYLYRKYAVPVGLIDASVGGSRIQAWMSEEALRQFPEDWEEVIPYRTSGFLASRQEEEQAEQERWFRVIETRDKGLTREPAWYKPEYDDSSWSTMRVPGSWPQPETGEKNGVTWFRKEVRVPVSLAGQQAILRLGRIMFSDTVWLNGKQVGTTDYQYPPRIYEIPAGLIKAGKNQITVRIISALEPGSFCPGKPYYLEIGDRRINLCGEWRFQAGCYCTEMPPSTWVPNLPMGLYNGMLAPLHKYIVKGILWYQGESNVENRRNYAEMFQNLIDDWRKKWGSAKLPFLFVQLPQYGEPGGDDGHSEWAALREAQRLALRKEETGMAVALDLGEWNDLHPLNKKAVAYRLALEAFRVVYKEEGIPSQPEVCEAERRGNAVVLTFRNARGGLHTTCHLPPGPFALADRDGNYHPAEARILGDKVAVFHPGLSEPAAVRYAWADTPEGPLLYNRAGLPVVPFNLKL